MLRPLRDRIVVRPIERTRSDALIVIDNENETLGEVVAVGPGVRKKGVLRPLETKPGDTVRFGCDYLNFPKYREAGVDYIVMQEADIAGIVDAR